MKTRAVVQCTGLLFLALTTAGSIGVHAQQVGPPAVPGNSRDTGSAFVQVSERVKLMGRFDVNKDGKVDATERAVYRQHVATQRQKFIQQFDLDGDGMLDERERANARAYWAEQLAKQKAAAKTIATPATAKP